MSALSPGPDCQAAFDALYATPRWSRLGWLYVGAGVLWCAAAAGPMSVAELGGIPMGVAFVLSLGILWPVLKCLLKQPLLYVLVAFGVWMCITVLWSPQKKVGLLEAAQLRPLWTILALWPLLGYRRKLLGALIAGLLLGNLSQLALWAGHHWHIPGLEYKPWADRNPGWWSHPAVTGYLLVGALGLHLPAAVMGRGQARLLGVGGCIVTWLGMLATGTRGAWIAAAALMVVVGAVAVWNAGAARWKVLTWTLVVALGAAGAGWFAVGAAVAARARAGVGEVRQALVNHDYSTDTGARIQFAVWAAEMFAEKPILGHGAGSFQPWSRAKLKAEGVDPDTVRTLPQAHNAWLHIAATQGLIGLALALVAVWMILRSAFAGAREGRTAWLGSYEAGPAFALVGMLLVTPFDVPYLNTPEAALLAVVATLCFPGRPRGASYSSPPMEAGPPLPATRSM